MSSPSATTATLEVSGLTHRFDLTKPVIAAVEGVATAAGCQLVASCDLAVAGDQARFALPGVSIGLFCSTPLVAVGRAISRKHAMEMALTGELYSAQDAERFGLINRVVPAGNAEAEATVRELVSRYAIEAIAIGNGTAGRETEAFVRSLGLPSHVNVLMVNESGASIYSASAVAREEFPMLRRTADE